MSEFAEKVLRQAKANTINKKTVDKLYQMKKLTRNEYETIIKVWENK